jgi:hypothetical protein
MQWNLGWRFWRGDAAIGSGKRIDESRREPETPKDWEARLIEEGVSSEWAERIAVQLIAAYRRLGRGSATALLHGASLAVAVQAGERANVERSMRDVREVERLLGAFSGELEKLDEVLEVLSAYAQRMRAKPAKANDRTLH